MDRREAERVIQIMLQADGGCPACVGALLCYFMARWPDHEGLAREMYMNEFGAPLEGDPNHDLDDEPLPVPAVRP